MPFDSLSAVKRVTPFLVLAAIIIRSANPPSITNVFFPLIMNLFPFFSALVSETIGLCLGPSSSAKQQVIFPLTISGRYFFFCSSVPSLETKLAPMTAVARRGEGG